jgi:hypothetical protein
MGGMWPDGKRNLDGPDSVDYVREGKGQVRVPHVLGLRMREKTCLTGDPCRQS